MCRDLAIKAAKSWFDFGGSRAISKLETFRRWPWQMTSVGAYRATTFSEIDRGRPRLMVDHSSYDAKVS